MFSKFFIDRPIFATVLAILMILAGLMTVFSLPVAQYPDITPPTVMVNASYPGADAETVAQTVGVPIEQQINGIEGMLYMSSNSGSDGSYSLTITFKNGTNLDDVAVEVQNRVQQAQAQLPTMVKEEGVSVQKNSSNNVLFVAIDTDRPDLYDATYLSNYAELHMVDPLTRVEGVGGVQAFGGGDYSMRIWLDPSRMAARKLSPSAVIAAIQAQNVEVSAGSVGANPGAGKTDFEYTVVSQGRLADASQFGDIVIRRGDDGSVLKLKDVARIDLGTTSYSVSSMVNGRGTGLLAISQLPGANAIDVADNSIKELDRLSQYFPEGVYYRIVMNSTDYVRESLKEVLRTFILTTLIVMAVIMIFLQNWRAVIIPMITIPVSLIATFAVMKVMGFSLNTLSLFGMVLAIAIVVDDAIVVVEDCSRIVDKGEMTPKQAAVQAMKELTGPVVGEVLVLLSVFIPTAFISGITGKLYKQFALTIAVSTAFSGFNALTLTPALCALMLTKRTPAKFFLFVWFNKFWDKCQNLYDRAISRMLKYPVISMGAFIIIAAVGIWGYNSWPSSYIPSEDMGYFMTSVELPESASLHRTENVVNSLAAKIKDIPGVKDVMAISGFSFMSGGSGTNLGILNVILEPWAKRGRKESIGNIMAQADRLSAQFPEALIYSVNPPAIPGLGISGGLEMQLLDVNSLGPVEMQKALTAIEAEAAKDKRIASVNSMYQGEVPQYRIKIDRDRVASLGLNLEDVFTTLSAYLGGNYVNDFVLFDRVYQVNLKGDAASRETVESIRRLSVAGADGEMVPFPVFSTIEPIMGQASVSRYNMYPTASLTANAAKGVSSHEAIDAMEEIVNKAVGRNFSYAWTGEAYQETSATTTISFVFIFAIVMTLLVLAAQYESVTDPIAVVLSMPVAILGTVIGCMIFNYSISIYTQIGLILLLGMSAKNAILIVEYAMDFRKSGIPVVQAAHDAGIIRLRPIIMTACAFVFGVLPMMFATGAGANSRRELGTAVVFGMALNALVGTLFVPTFWLVLQRFNEKYLKHKPATD